MVCVSFCHGFVYCLVICVCVLLCVRLCFDIFVFIVITCVTYDVMKCVYCIMVVSCCVMYVLLCHDVCFVVVTWHVLLCHDFVPCLMCMSCSVILNGRVVLLGYRCPILSWSVGIYDLNIFVSCHASWCIFVSFLMTYVFVSWHVTCVCVRTWMKRMTCRVTPNRMWLVASWSPTHAASTRMTTRSLNPTSPSRWRATVARNTPLQRPQPLSRVSPSNISLTSLSCVECAEMF